MSTDSEASSDDFSEDTHEVSQTPQTSQREVRISKKTGKYVSNSYLSNLDTLIKSKIQVRISKRGGFKKKEKKKRKAKKSHRGNAKSRAQRKKEKSITPAKKKRKVREPEVPFLPVAEDVPTWESSFHAKCPSTEDQEKTKDELSVSTPFGDLDFCAVSFFWYHVSVQEHTIVMKKH